MGWRDDWEVHPAADVFPMMSDEELEKLGQDIKENGLKVPIDVQISSSVLLDGRNRLEAMERAGIGEWVEQRWIRGDPAAHIISCNIHRRHLTKQQQADLIVNALAAAEDAKAEAWAAADAEAEKVCKPCTVSKGGRGNKNPVKQKAIEEGKKHGIAKRTMQKAVAKADPEAREARAKERLEKEKEAYQEEMKREVELERQCWLAAGRSEEDYNAGGRRPGFYIYGGAMQGEEREAWYREQKGSHGNKKKRWRTERKPDIGRILEIKEEQDLDYLKHGWDRADPNTRAKFRDYIAETKSEVFNHSYRNYNVHG
jgi:hypothetical protein